MGGGPNQVGPRRVGPRRVGPRRVGPRRVGPRRVRPRRVGGPNLEKVGPRWVGPERVGPRRVEPRKGGGAERVGPRKGVAPKGGAPKGGEAQNFALFLTFPATVSLFLCLSGGLLVKFWWCFEAPGRSNVHVWSSRAVACEPRRPGLVGPQGFHTTAREPKRAQFRVPAFKTPPKFNEKTPRETQKQRNGGGKGKKKSEILGGLAEGVQGSPNQQQPQQPQPTQRQTQNKWGPARSPKQGLGSLGVGHNNTRQHTTTQQHTTQQHNNNTKQQQHLKNSPKH